MAKYTLKALNVVIGGKLFKREDKFVFDTNTMNKKELEDAAKAGFLVLVEEKKTKTEEKVEEPKKEVKVEEPKTEEKVDKK